MTIRIDVTQADIDAGIARHPLGCPIARAITRTLDIPMDLGTGVSSRFITTLKDGIRQDWVNDDAIRMWIMRFDLSFRRVGVQPFTLILDEGRAIMAPSVESGLEVEEETTITVPAPVEIPAVEPAPELVPA